jgi:hypothetical protein
VPNCSGVRALLCAEFEEPQRARDPERRPLARGTETPMRPMRPPSALLERKPVRQRKPQHLPALHVPLPVEPAQTVEADADLVVAGQPYDLYLGHWSVAAIAALLFRLRSSHLVRVKRDAHVSECRARRSAFQVRENGRCRTHRSALRPLCARVSFSAAEVERHRGVVVADAGRDSVEQARGVCFPECSTQRGASGPGNWKRSRSLSTHRHRMIPG